MLKRSVFWIGVGICIGAGWTGRVEAQPYLFDRVTSTSGIGNLIHGGIGNADLRIGTGAVWFDYDNDGDLDLFMTQRNGPNLLFENDGTGSFTDVAALRGVTFDTHDAAGAAAADYDNDGDLDLYLANSDGDLLLRNELVETGSPDFSDVTATAFPGETLPLLDARGASVSWGDYDNDGYLDFYVAHHLYVGADRFDYTADSQDRLFHNNGDGTFTDVSYLIAGVDDANGNNDLDGYGFIAGWTDYDGDGDIDIFLMNDCPYGPKGNKLWRNDGGTDPFAWNFTEMAESVGLTDEATCVNAMGLALGDYNRDGLWDYFYTDIGTATLIRNDGDTGSGTTFTDVTMVAGVFEDVVPGTDPPQNRVTWGAVFLDYDLDGFQDLAVAAGTLGHNSNANPQPNLLYHNNGDGTFAKVETDAWEEDTRRGRTIVRGDYDGDGDPDLFLVNYDQGVELLRNNNANGNNWLILDLEGAGPAAGGSNKNGIGAKVQVTTPDAVTQHEEVRSGSSLGGGDDLAAYFGLGMNTTADIEVTWPSGITQTLVDVPAGQRLRIKEAVGDYTIDATPQNPPIVIDAAGGSFSYTLTVANYAASAQTPDVWVNITGPGVNLVRGPIAATIASGGLLSKTLSQNVPAGAPAGTYTITAKVGSFPIASATDSFVFTKAAAKGGTAMAGGAWSDTWAEASTETIGGQALRFHLAANHPNPFDEATTITFDLPEARHVRLRVYNLLGQEVMRPVDGFHEAGRHRVRIEAERLGAGVYLYTLEAGDFRATRRMVRLR